jgi:hypothetical protein
MMKKILKKISGIAIKKREMKLIKGGFAGVELSGPKTTLIKGGFLAGVQMSGPSDTAIKVTFQ